MRTQTEVDARALREAWRTVYYRSDPENDSAGCKHFILRNRKPMRVKSSVKQTLKLLAPPLLVIAYRHVVDHDCRTIITPLLPPIFIRLFAGRTLTKTAAPPETVQVAALSEATETAPAVVAWEYMPQGWATEKVNPAIKGWNVASLLDTYEARWQDFAEMVQSRLPLGISPEAELNDHKNISFHNIVLSYGYVLALAARFKERLSLLDWGGGIGHYYLFSQALLPELQIDYTCVDLPVFADYGQHLLPETRFTTDSDAALARTYDLILVSGSFHYAKDWKALLRQLAGATGGYLFVTRLPTVHNVPSYVMLQRPYEHGLDTEYLGWCVNRIDLLSCAEEAGLELVREFIIETAPYIFDAPEQCDFWGYLFRKPQRDQETVMDSETQVETSLCSGHPYSPEAGPYRRGDMLQNSTKRCRWIDARRFRSDGPRRQSVDI
jgi:putative methyltransferase (TIGR04325 family)